VKLSPISLVSLYNIVEEHAWRIWRAGSGLVKWEGLRTESRFVWMATHPNLSTQVPLESRLLSVIRTIKPSIRLLQGRCCVPWTLGHSKHILTPGAHPWLLEFEIVEKWNLFLFSWMNILRLVSYASTLYLFFSNIQASFAEKLQKSVW
jgi:hypothetical protein